MDQEYKTDSLNLASYLLACDCLLDRVERLNPESSKFIFIFFNNSSLQTLVSDYFSLKSLVNPQKYYNALKNLRQVIYSNRDLEPGNTNMVSKGNI